MNKDDKKFPKKKKKYYSIYHSRDDLEKETLFRETFSGFAEKIFEETQNTGQTLGECFNQTKIINPINEIKKSWRKLIQPPHITNQLNPVKFADHILTIFCKVPFMMDLIRQQHQATILKSIQQKFPQVQEIKLTSDRTIY